MPSSKVAKQMEGIPLERLKGIATAYAVTMIITAVVSIVLYIQTAMWIYNINRSGTCKCADDWRKQYVLVFPPISIAVGIFSMPFLQNIAPLISLLLMAGWVVFIVAALQYAKKLRADKCTCATAGYGDEAMQAYAYVPIVSWSFSVLFILAVQIIVWSMRRK